MNVATVKVLSLPRHVKNAYDYADVSGECFVGAFVGVPFGQGSHISLGVVTEVRQEEGDGLFAYKEIFNVYRREFSLSEEYLGLISYLEETTLCSFGDAVRTVYPVSVLGTLNECYEVSDGLPTELNARAFAVYEYIASRPGITRKELIDSLGSGAAEAAAYLTKSGHIRSYALFEDSKNLVFDEFYKGTGRPIVTKSDKLRAAVEFLNEYGECEKSELCKSFGITAAHLKKALDSGAVEQRRVQRYRGVYMSAGKPAEMRLSEAQESAKDQLLSLYRTGEPRAALLYGVTGSGKTAVIKAVCDEVIASGRQVIMLVPEISLTPQSVKIFSSYYKDRIAVLHSYLSEGERLDAWRRIRSGAVDMVIGTRSASFAPVPDLGLFIIDEEQEHTYKSESNPKYHARDVARYRCAKNNALMLLSSATPSVESFYKAELGKYSLVTLGERYGGATLPEVCVSDMRRELSEGRTGAVGSELLTLLKSNLSLGKQSILFLNRRGFSHFLVCKMCGKAIACSRCDVSMTLHRKSEGRERLMCHYCGSERPVPERCPECGSEHVEPVGFGIQKVEDELKALLPDARILRMDADTTKTRSSYDRILGDFRDGKADILLGTQMVTKGHDFPNVTLVGVITADASLYIDDYNAAEKTFSLLTQVIGRAGRADSKGTAVIQTFNPDHELIELAKKQDYSSFYAQEIKLRRALQFPPFCDIVRVLASSADERAAMSAAREFAEGLINYDKEKYGEIPLAVFGPMEARIRRVNNSVRYQTVVKCRLNAKSRRLISDIYKRLLEKYAHKAQIGVDPDPDQI